MMMMMMMMMMMIVYTYIVLIICQEIRTLHTITILVSQQTYEVSIISSIILGSRKQKAER